MFRPSGFQTKAEDSSGLEISTWNFDWENQELSTYLKDIYPNPEQRLERNFPPGFREYLETIKLKELKALCRQTPGARSAGKKSDLVRELLIFTQF